MVSGRSLVAAGLTLAAIIGLLLLPGYLQSPSATPPAVDNGQVDLGQKARDIVAADPSALAPLGNDTREIGGIIWNQSVADIFYEAQDSYYRVEVGLETGRVLSVRAEDDPEVLAWLANVSVTVEPSVGPVT